MSKILILVVQLVLALFGSRSNGIKEDCSKELSSEECIVEFPVPINNNCSITYNLYTPKNRDCPCYVEPNDLEFDRCEFDYSLKTKFIVHGWLVKLLPGSIFELMKDELLLEDNYNVIIVNWTKYSQDSYESAFENSYLVGLAVGEFINYLKIEKGVNPQDIHIIGHSLGAQASGVAGKQVRNLKRISGLDPAFPLFNRSITFNRLEAYDAEFVDVIHCSDAPLNITTGAGVPYPVGQIDFYPNGGISQEACYFGGNYTTVDGEQKVVDSNLDLSFCRHDICAIYYMFSIRTCKFQSWMCDSYEDYNAGSCFTESDPTELMGYPARLIPGLPDHSLFYLNTTSSPPYCSSIS